MFFKPIIDRRGLAGFASDLGIPAKNVRSWYAQDSIPGGWFARVSNAGLATLEELIKAAERRERHAAEEREARAQRREAA